jgi:hypothetical protein
MAGCDGDTAEHITEATVERTVEVGRGIGSGITKGARAGRESTESTDGAQVIGAYEQLEGNGTVEITSAREEGEGCVVVIRFGNDTDQPMRIAHLDDDGALLAIDMEQVAHPDARGPGDFTVHPHSRHAIDVAFDAPLARLRTIRIWGHELTLPTE